MLKVNIVTKSVLVDTNSPALKMSTVTKYGQNHNHIKKLNERSFKLLQ